MAAAVETKTTSMAEAAAVGRRRHFQWRQRKHMHHAVVDNGDGTMTTIMMTMMTTVTATTVGRGVEVAV